MTDTQNAPKRDETTEPVMEAAAGVEGATVAEAEATKTNGETVEAGVSLAEAQAKAAEYLDGWQRARAEFANYRKRADKEREDAHQNAVVETLRKLLPVLDDFDRALSKVPTERVEDELIKGFSLIHRKLVGLIENAGLKVVNPQGEPFNPAYHEAIGHDDTSDVSSGHVSQVLQKGYLYGERVIRPALVRVAS